MFVFQLGLRVHRGEQERAERERPSGFVDYTRAAIKISTPHIYTEAAQPPNTGRGVFGLSRESSKHVGMTRIFLKHGAFKHMQILHCPSGQRYLLKGKLCACKF